MAPRDRSGPAVAAPAAAVTGLSTFQLQLVKKCHADSPLLGALSTGEVLAPFVRSLWRRGSEVREDSERD